MWGCIYFVVFVQRKKKSEIKRRNKIPQRKKKEKKEREIPKIELFSCIIFNKRLEENKKVVSGIA